MFTPHLTLLLASLCLLGSVVQAAQFGTAVPMSKKTAATFYVPVQFAEGAGNDLMVDTGSDYVTINAATLDKLKELGKVDFIKQITGVMANGTDMIVPIYRIAKLNIGCCCIVQDVEAAVFADTERQILGLSALKKVAPFALSLDPAHLLLSNCQANAPNSAKG